ncbi:hypothetical protein CHS0354_016208 [Potamilus streckersoni]|uniref:DDE-1 domain-containing protein n=1 Tax=Potamilus streckersoni TaxID=2493646 RepID=A0AAE0RXF0_9BIVA|nr:hypothetical protein CHS0354_016208 [Potamilus streckersoni]
MAEHWACVAQVERQTFFFYFFYLFFFLQWQEHFTSFVKCTKDSPQILLLDGYHSHKTLETVLYSREKGIVLITFPPHCTHRLQPLDVTFFKALKGAFILESGNWMTNNPGKRISAFDVAAIFFCSI